MNVAFQELLPFIPLSKLKFVTPVPKELMYYKSIMERVPEHLLEQPTLLVLNNNDEIEKLNNKEVASRLIQDPHLTAIVINVDNGLSELLAEDMVVFYREFTIPIVNIIDSSILPIFQQKNEMLYCYGQLSEELIETMEVGFIKLATELTKGLKTPLLYLNEDNQLLWHYGTEEDLRAANRWLNTHRNELENGNYANSFLYKKSTSPNSNVSNSFELYFVNIAGLTTHKLVVSAKLVSWQKRLIDKLAGLMALLLQTEKMFDEQESRMKEHFVYDLLYHKFESHSIMVNQARSWGWNLEIPHHLLLIDVEVQQESDSKSMVSLDEIVAYIESSEDDFLGNQIVFPFHNQVVILVEDDKQRTKYEQQLVMREKAEKIIGILSNYLPNYQFTVGIGKLYEDTTYLNKSFQEAKMALKFGAMWYQSKRVYHINDLGVLRLLIQIHPEILLDFQEDYLQPLIDSDENHGTEFIDTLRAYIQHRGIVANVADNMYIHPNTLRNRIKRIEELTGVDLQNPEEFMNLIVAVKLLSFLE